MAKDQPDHTTKAAANKAHVKQAASAAHLEHSAEEQTDSADRRTQLAADRTVLAAERTYAAWVRTGLAALASGVGAKALLANVLPGLMVELTSSILVLFSALCFCAAIWRELVPKVSNPVSEVPRIPRAVLFVVNGFLTTVAVFAFVSIWISWLGSVR